MYSSAITVALDTEGFWDELRLYTNPLKAMFVIVDSILDQSHTSEIALISRHWWGKYHDVVQEINLISLVWTADDAVSACIYYLYNKVSNDFSKNDHFRTLFQHTQGRGFPPTLEAFDSWYNSLENLKLVCDFGWEWLNRLISNLHVSVHPGELQVVSDLDISDSGRKVPFRGYDMFKMFRMVAPCGNADCGATSRIEMTPAHFGSASLGASPFTTFAQLLNFCKE